MLDSRLYTIYYRLKIGMGESSAGAQSNDQQILEHALLKGWQVKLNVFARRGRKNGGKKHTQGLD